MEALWNRRLGGQCLSIGDYVAMPGPPDEVTAAGGPLMLASLGGRVLRIGDPERILYSTLMNAIDAGLIRTVEDTVKVLRHASQPLGQMGVEWLERQARAMERGGE